MAIKGFTVGVFPKARGKGFTAYTLWYNKEWNGCCEHVVTASNGTEAKKTAIEAHRANCLTKQKEGFQA